MPSARPKVAINGFGRIGRTFFRQVAQGSDIEVVAVNDITPDETVAYLTRYDTIHGRFPGPVTLVDGRMRAGTQDVRMLEEKDPGNRRGEPWAWTSSSRPRAGSASARRSPAISRRVRSA